MVTRILYEDKALLAVDKPAGTLVVRGREGEAEPSLVDLLSAERKEKLYVVHRIDRGTSGVLLFARDAASHRTLNQAFEAGLVSKRYLALVRGVPEVGPSGQRTSVGPSGQRTWIGPSPRRSRASAAKPASDPSRALCGVLLASQPAPRGAL